MRFCRCLTRGGLRRLGVSHPESGDSLTSGGSHVEWHQHQVAASVDNSRLAAREESVDLTIAPGRGGVGRLQPVDLTLEQVAGCRRHGVDRCAVLLRTADGAFSRTVPQAEGWPTPPIWSSIPATCRFSMMPPPGQPLAVDDVQHQRAQLIARFGVVNTGRAVARRMK